MKKYFLLGILFFLIGLGGVFLLTHNTSKQEENTISKAVLQPLLKIII